MENNKNFDNLKYHQGFGNHFVSESVPNTIHPYQNTPQKVKHGLYAEQLSGTAFTLPRHKNKRSWLYRIQPSVTQGPLKESDKEFENWICDYTDSQNYQISPNQLRWKKLDLKTGLNFLEGIVSYAGAGSPEVKKGLNIYGYQCDKSMEDVAFYNSDGDFLIVPHEGDLNITTEFGLMKVCVKEMCVIPRGCKFQVDVTQKSTGWICEIFKGHFELPDLGPIGANGLANPRDFEAPIAKYEQIKKDWKIYNKFINKFFVQESDHSPFDVVAWHGNYYPYKYDLSKFNVVNSVSFDHLDPSIFTVLTAQSDEYGLAICDFVIFKQRWMVAENTFRPPYYHRNTMSEFMGNIYGVYDAKGKGFGPGCSSLHQPMTPHGPDSNAFEKAIEEDQKPIKYPDTMSFMFESCLMLKVAKTAYDKAINIDHEYHECWKGLKDNFKKEEQFIQNKIKIIYNTFPKIVDFIIFFNFLLIFEQFNFLLFSYFMISQTKQIQMHFCFLKKFQNFSKDTLQYLLSSGKLTRGF